MALNQIETPTQPVYPQNTTGQVTTNPIFAWASDENEANRCPVPANSWAIIMNRNEDVFYVKRCDRFSNPYPLEIYDFTKRVPPDPTAGMVRREEFDSLLGTINALSEKISGWDKVMTELGAGKE